MSLRTSSRPGTPGFAAGTAVPESPFGGTFPVDDDDDELMQPAQYIMRRDTSQKRYQDLHDEEWADVGASSARLARSRSASSMTAPDDEEYDLVEGSDDGERPLLPSPSSHSFPRHYRKFSEFMSSPAAGSRRSSLGSFERERKWGWSWSFLLGGRRRRLTVGLPSVQALREALSFGPGSTSPARRYRLGVWKTTLRDMWGIVWPAILSWCFIAWSLS